MRVCYGQPPGLHFTGVFYVGGSVMGVAIVEHDYIELL